MRLNQRGEMESVPRLSALAGLEDRPPGKALTLLDVRAPTLLDVGHPYAHSGTTQTLLPIYAKLPPLRETVFDLPGR